MSKMQHGWIPIRSQCILIILVFFVLEQEVEK